MVSATSAPSPVAAPSADAARMEYADVSANLRFYRAISLAQAAVVVLVNCILVALLWSKNAAMSKRTETFLMSSGAFSAVLFLMSHEHADKIIRVLRSRADILEKQLNFQQYSLTPAGEIFGPAAAARLLTAGLLAFWCAQMYWR